MKTIKPLPKDTDLAGVDNALRRAAKKAREVAKKNHTPCYVFEDGKIVDCMKRAKNRSNVGSKK